MNNKEFMIELLKIENPKKIIGIIVAVLVLLVMNLVTLKNMILSMVFQAILVYFIVQIVDFDKISYRKNIKRKINGFTTEEKLILARISNTSDGCIFFHEDQDFYQNYSKVMESLQEKGVVYHQFEEIYEMNYFYLEDKLFLEELKEAKKLGIL